jgi:hypothetical protein
MNTNTFAQFVLGGETQSIDENAAKEVAQLISGSLVYRLYESLVNRAH